MMPTRPKRRPAPSGQRWLIDLTIDDKKQLDEKTEEQTQMSTWREAFTIFFELDQRKSKTERAGQIIGTGIGLAHLAVALAPVAVAVALCSMIAAPFWAIGKLWTRYTTPEPLDAARDGLEAAGFDPARYLPPIDAGCNLDF
jgi:hypothetical protein